MVDSYECVSNGGGSQSIEDEFHAGNYTAIVRLHVDAVSAGPFRGELPYVVGALAFVGRLEEARALLSSELRRRAVASETRIVAARFFLGVAYCRAGRSDDARREFLLNARARNGESLARFYVFQGLGCYRYFTGLLRKSARLALCALEHAFAAGFPYGRLLATDLRGHTLVQLGQVQNGLSVLETARALAGSLALAGNAAAIDCSSAIYRARFGVTPIREGIVRLKALAGGAMLEDSYSERSVRLELAVQTALAGDGDAARQMLERLATERVPDGGDARARIRFLLAWANVVRLRHGVASMQPFVTEAHAILANAPDLALQVDVLSLELIATADPERASRIRAELLSLCALSGIERVWLRRVECSDDSDCGIPPGAEVLDEDRLGALYVACCRPSPELALKLIETGHWGLLPLALRLIPGRRLLMLDRYLVVEDYGNLQVTNAPTEGTLRFLSALAEVELRTKEELLALVWGIGAYRPAAHDGVIHTAVSRARAQLGPRGHWVEAALGGYRLASGVEVVSWCGALAPSSKPVQHPMSSGISTQSRAGRTSGSPPPGAPDAVLTLLSQNRTASSRDVASHLGVSEMTALRRLREHVEQGAISREGKGKHTRYRLLRSPV